MSAHRHFTEHKSFRKADEVRQFPDGRAEILKVGGGEVGRLVFKPPAGDGGTTKGLSRRPTVVRLLISNITSVDASRFSWMTAGVHRGAR